jgi:RNA polymerase sigma factor (sigma-70 family)
MPPDSAGPGPLIVADERAERIRAVLESDADGLFRAITVKLQKVFKHLRRDEVAEQAYEVLDETVRRALARPETLDPSRSAFNWLVGIAVNVLRGRARDIARERRHVTHADLGDQAWTALVGRLQRGPSDAAVGDRIDLREALVRLDPGSRQVLECRFFRDLDGEELAEALGAPSVGAARTRVCRALQRLRNQLGADGPEETP